MVCRRTFFLVDSAPGRLIAGFNHLDRGPLLPCVERQWARSLSEAFQGWLQDKRPHKNTCIREATFRSRASLRLLSAVRGSCAGARESPGTLYQQLPDFPDHRGKLTVLCDDDASIAEVVVLVAAAAILATGAVIRSRSAVLRRKRRTDVCCCDLYGTQKKGSASSEATVNTACSDHH